MNDAIDRCFDCGSRKIVDLGDDYEIDNPFLGKVSSGSNHVFKCLDCGMLLMDKKCRDDFKEQCQSKVESFLLNFHNPKVNFNEYTVESMLKSMVREYDEDFIFHLNFNGIKMFWKKSVEKYLESGKDGRISIC